MARATLGRAIREARGRRLHPPIAALAAVPPVAIPDDALTRLRGPLLASALFAALAGVLLLVAVPVPVVGPAPAAGPPPPPERTQAPLGGRGRVSATLAPVALAPTPPLTPEAATPEPTVAPTQAVTAPPTAAPARTAASAPGGVPGGPGGVPGGVPGATGGGAPTPQPTTLRAPLQLPPVPRGHYRVLVRVTDTQTRQPLPDVCVVIGTSGCPVSALHTNELGIWYADIPQEAKTTYWDLHLELAGYERLDRIITARGRDLVVDVGMRHR